MPPGWAGSFYGVYLGGTLKTPGVERRVPRWWLNEAPSIWNLDISQHVRALRAVERR